MNLKPQLNIGEKVEKRAALMAIAAARYTAHEVIQGLVSQVDLSRNIDHLARIFIYSEIELVESLHGEQGVDVLYDIFREAYKAALIKDPRLVQEIDGDVIYLWKVGDVQHYLVFVSAVKDGQKYNTAEHTLADSPGAAAAKVVQRLRREGFESIVEGWEIWK